MTDTLAGPPILEPAIELARFIKNSGPAKRARPYVPPSGVRSRSGTASSRSPDGPP